MLWTSTTLWFLSSQCGEFQDEISYPFRFLVLVSFPVKWICISAENLVDWYDFAQANKLTATLAACVGNLEPTWAKPATDPAQGACTHSTVVEKRIQKRQGLWILLSASSKLKKKHDADLKFSHSLVLLQKNHLPTISAMPAAAFKPRSLISSCCLYPKPCSKRQVDHHRTSEKKLRQREHGHGLALSQFFLRQLQHRAHLPFANFSRRVPEPLSARWPSLQLPLLMAASMGRQSLDILGSSWQWGICKSKARTAPAEGELKKSPTDHLKFKNNCMKLEWISEIPPATYSCIFISTP